MSAQCRSCGDPIEWAVTILKKRIPINVTPDPKGNIVLLRNTNPPTALYAKRDEPGDRYTSHFAKCPDRIAWRQKKGRGKYDKDV